MDNGAAPLSRTQAQQAVEAIGWRYLLGNLATSVAVNGVAAGLDVAAASLSASGNDTDEHLRLDLRADRVELSLQTRALAAVTQRDVDLAHAISRAVSQLNLSAAGGQGIDATRSVQMLEIAIDALDIPAVRPFWKAVMAYVDEPGANPATGGLIDPAGQGPAIWFQQMDAPRPQRNRIHFDVTVAHDEAAARIAAAVDAGGVLVSEAEARAFWILADSEANEACVCTWQDRD